MKVDQCQPREIFWTAFQSSRVVNWVKPKPRLAGNQLPFGGPRFASVALRSVLNEEDEEAEILPHIKMSKDFEIYEPITMHPLFSILPWDDNVKPSYDIFFIQSTP